MLNLEGFERINEAECWAKYGWGCEAKQGTDVLHGIVNGYEVFCDEMNESYEENGKPCFGCEIYDQGGDMVGQWFSGNYEEAIYGAFVEAVGYDAMRENGNCEDAVNVTTYNAYEAIFGETPSLSADIETVNAIMGLAVSFVKTNGKSYGIEWEEYRW